MALVDYEDDSSPDISEQPMLPGRAGASATGAAVVAPSAAAARVCGCGTAAKYTCPGCAAQSCSLACVKAHKQASGCSGTRNRVQYTDLRGFHDGVLQSGALGGALSRQRPPQFL